MSEMRRNLLVGMFMILGLGALGFLLVMFGEAPSWLGGAEYPLKIRVSEIYGISDGTPVLMNGIQIGRVESLEFLDPAAPENGVEVVAQIKDEFKVPRGAKAQCIAPALGLGRGRIEIFAVGEGQPALEKNQVILGSTESAFAGIIPETLFDSLDTTVVNIGKFADQLTPVAEDLHELLKKAPISDMNDPAKMTSNLFTAIQRLDQILRHFDQVLGDPDVQSGIKESIENVRTMTADGKVAFADLRDTSANLKTDASRIADKVEGTVDDLGKRVNEIADATLPFLDDAAKIAADLRVIASNIREGKGTVGLLLNDNRLYEVMVLSFERATDMIDSLRRLAYRFEKSGRVGLNVGGWPVEKKIPE